MPYTAVDKQINITAADKHINIPFILFFFQSDENIIVCDEYSQADHFCDSFIYFVMFFHLSGP